MATVHLVEHDAAVRAELQRVLASVGYRVCTYPLAADYLAAEPEPEPAVVLLTLQPPDLDGIEFPVDLERRPAWLHPVIFLGDDMDVSTSVRAMRCGAQDVLLKPLDGSQLIEAVAIAHARDVRERELRAMECQVRERVDSLSERQREVLRDMIAGTPNSGIASRLGVSERTVKFDRARIMARLGVRTLAELFRILYAVPGVTLALQ